MFNYKQTLETMRKERASLQAELEKLDRAISALASVVGGAVAKQPAKKRQQVLQPQKQQPTKLRSKGSQSSKSKGKISAEGLRNIIEAQKRRWAKVRAAAKTKAKVSAV